MKAMAIMLGAATLALSAGASSEVPSWRNPPADPVRGAELAGTCTACHASTAAPRLRRQRASYLFRALLAYRSGARDAPLMAPFVQGLSDQDARDLAAALAGELLAAPPRPRADLAGYRIAAAQCLWCHGETGIGEFEGLPVLTGQDPAYLASALAAYRSGARTDPTMRAVAAALDPAQDAALAEYYAGHAWLERVP